MADPTAPSRLKSVAVQERSYVDGDRRKFIHLVDGGIADNLGLRGAAERAIQLDDPHINSTTPIRLPRRMAFIIVDANTEKDYGCDAKDQKLGLGALLHSVVQVTISRYSFETVELFREVLGRLDREREVARLQAGDPQAAKTETYIVELHFSQAARESDRNFFNSVPTSLQLPASTVDRLKLIAREELKNNPEFRRLADDLRQPRLEPNPDQPVAANCCE
jgi:NTE family protein